jgi:hypothetical protein
MGLAAIGAWMISFGALSQQSPRVQAEREPNSSTETTQNADKEQQRAVSLPATVLIVHTEPPKQIAAANADQGGNEASEYWVIFGRRLKITDTTLVAVTFLIFIATCFLWWATRRLVREAQETSRRQLRAYIGYHGTHPCPNMDKTKLAHIQMVFKNFGQTPAYDVEFFLNCPAVFKNEAEGKWSKGQSSYAKSVVNPGQFIPYNRGYQVPEVAARIADLTTADPDEPHSARAFVYLWGEVHYVDAFGGKRWTRFRWHVGGMNIKDGEWSICRGGNEADEHHGKDSNPPKPWWRFWA